MLAVQAFARAAGFRKTRTTRDGSLAAARGRAHEIPLAYFVATLPVAPSIFIFSVLPLAIATFSS